MNPWRVWGYGAMIAGSVFVLYALSLLPSSEDLGESIGGIVFGLIVFFTGRGILKKLN